MSLINSPEMTDEKLAAQRANGRKSRGPVTPQGKANSAAVNWRHGFYASSRADTMAALGEDPADYIELMESLWDDLQPRPGLEKILVNRMGEAIWRMDCARRMQEGYALRIVKKRLGPEELLLTTRAAKAIENLAPYESLDAALGRTAGPTPEEIQAFAESRPRESSPEIGEFILALKSLENPMEPRERRKECRKLRARLHPLMAGYSNAAWCLARDANKTRSAESLAALAVPDMESGALLQKREDSDLRRLARLTETFMKVRQGRFALQTTKNEGRSHDLHENKESNDNMTDLKTTDCPISDELHGQ